MERTFIMLKPGVIQRRIAGELLSRFERKGLKIIALKMLRIDKPLAETHYQEHRGKDFYQDLIDYILSGPAAALVLEAEGAIALVRRLIGATKVEDALPGTIRGDYAASTTFNVIHASDSPENAAREIALFFKPEELAPWEDGNARWY